jgi:hypothetical protein
MPQPKHCRASRISGATAVSASAGGIRVEVAGAAAAPQGVNGGNDKSPSTAANPADP